MKTKNTTIRLSFRGSPVFSAKTLIWTAAALLAFFGWSPGIVAQDSDSASGPAPDGWTPAKRVVSQGQIEGTILLKAAPKRLLNIDFGAYWELAVGLAAIGITTNDTWNPYADPWQTWSLRTNLVWWDGAPCPVRMTVENAPGQWQSDVLDPMFRTYSYSHNGGPITVTVADLPSALYDFYLYGHATDTQNGVFQVSTPESGRYFEEKATTTSAGWREPVWREGQQFVVFRNIPVNGDPVEILVTPGASPIPILSGLQIVKVRELAARAPYLGRIEANDADRLTRAKVSPPVSDNDATPVTQGLTEGVLQEEGNIDLQGALRSYQRAISQFDRQRPMAANAIFRSGECYRKLGRMAEAKTQYARILREFPDQRRLAELSHKYLFAE